jgi:hypothetical protein
MRNRKIVAQANGTPVNVARPRLVKAAEFAARREAAVAAERARFENKLDKPVAMRAPRGEAEAREMFSQLFEAA